MNSEDTLQSALEAYENGRPLDEVLAELPTEEAELLRLAAQTHQAGQSLPALNPLKAQSQQQRVTAAVRPLLGLVEQPTAPSRGNLARLAIQPRWTLLAAAATFTTFFVLICIAGLAFLLTNHVSARSATLMDVAGVVEIAPDANGNQWTPVAQGQKLHAGQALRTRTASSATLIYYDGSRTAIEPETQIILTDLAGGWDLLAGRALKVRLEQLAGETVHSVVPLKGRSSYFDVVTTAGTASVHGTIFDVSIAGSGLARFAVDRGTVQVSRSGASVTLTAGQAILSSPQSELQPPSYQFFVQGILETIDGGLWIVAGVPIQVGADLGAGMNFQPGDWLAIRGRILADGTYQADSIAPARSEHLKLRFTGVVESIDAQVWVVSGQTVQVGSETEIETGIQIGDPVEVNYVLLPDGSKLAREIERLVEESDTTEPVKEKTRTPEPRGTPSPTAYPLPDTSATPQTTLIPEPTPTFEGNRGGCSGEDRQHPEGLTLSERWGVPYGEIMSWFCQGFGFGEIDLAYELARDSGKPVSEIFAMKAGGMGWGQIKQELSPKDQKPTRESKPTKAPKPTKPAKK